MLVPLTIAFFLYSVLFVVMGWETAAAIAGGLGVLNQALVALAAMSEPSAAPTVDTGLPETDDGLG